jgi:predicted DNA repair protein MutK
MSGLLALLDDVAGIAKVAAASIDDVAAQALKAGSKAAGALIDDAAVTPKYLHGFAASRELPVIWKITKGSLKNKLLYLLPIGLLLANFAPWLISPLLMLGGSYLCFEGAEKI